MLSALPPAEAWAPPQCPNHPRARNWLVPLGAASPGLVANESLPVAAATTDAVQRADASDDEPQPSTN